MAGATLILPLGWALAGLALGLVRLGWGTGRAIAVLGWAIGAGAVTLLGAHSGAWGMATGFVTGMVAALAFVLHAAWQSRPRPAGRSRRKAIAPAARGDLALARRLAVFTLVVPAGFAAALWLAFACQALARRGAPLDADSLALTLFLAPAIWVVLMVWQMMQPAPIRMLHPLLLMAAAGGALWGLA